MAATLQTETRACVGLPAPGAWADVRGVAGGLEEDLLVPGLGMGAWGLRVHQDTLLPTRHIFITINARTWLPHPQNSQAIAPRLGNPPASVGDRGVGQGWGILYILCHTNPQVLILAGFVFILIFFSGFDFFK